MATRCAFSRAAASCTAADEVDPESIIAFCVVS
jgi:hypothetical protein